MNNEEENRKKKRWKMEGDAPGMSVQIDVNNN